MSDSSNEKPKHLRPSWDEYFLKLADRRIGTKFAALRDNDDAFTISAADAALAAN